MKEQGSKKRIMNLMAKLVVFFMVLSFALPYNPSISFADSNHDVETSLFSLFDNDNANVGKTTIGVMDDEKTNGWEALFGEGSTRTKIFTEEGTEPSGAPSTPVAAQQAAGTYITVKDQYGNAVDNVYFTIYNTYDRITYYGKAVQGVLYLYSSNNKYENLSLEAFDFNENRYHQITVNATGGDAANYTLDSSVVLTKFYIQNGKVILYSGSFAITLQSKAQPPAPVGDTMTAKDTKGNPAQGIAFLLYKEGEANIQANLISNSTGALAYKANSQVFDPKTLAAGTYTVKVTPQSSSDTAKSTMSWMPRKSIPRLP